MAHDLELLVDDAKFGESPRWHDGALWFSDIGDDKVWRITPDGDRTLVLSGVRAPSGLGWTLGGDMLVASLHDHTIHRLRPDGAVDAFSGPDRHGTVGTNDMATACGRSYVSCAGHVYQTGDTFETLSAPTGSILLLDHASGAVRTVASGYRMPNGIAFSPNGQRLVFSELFASRLLQFDVAADGSLSGETVFAALDGMADGICMDAEGAVWAAVGGPGGARWQRTRAGGEVTDAIPLDGGWNCIATALGGADGRDLFLVANYTESPEDVFNGKARSRVYRTRADVPAPPAL